MTYARLRWICSAVEYDKLTKHEASALYDFVDKFTAGKDSKSAEKALEVVFAEVQWREDKEVMGRALKLAASPDQARIR